MMQYRRIFVSALLVASCLAAPGFADDAPGEEAAAEEPKAAIRERIVVTANRLEAETREVGSSVTVITAEQIALSAKTTVAELLRTVPGLEVVRGGGPGQITSVFVRGGSSSQTLVLLDGVRLNAPTTGAFDLANLTTDAIERIEIVRGPQSTLYGSEAVAGVINIFSKGGRDGRHVTALAEAGSFGARRLVAGVDGGSERFDYALTVSDESTDGVSSASERAGNRERDPYDVTSAVARLGWRLAGDGEVGLDLRFFDAEVGNDGFDFLLGPVDDLNRVQTREGLTGSLRVRQQVRPRWRQTFVLGLNDERLAGSDPDDAFSNFAVDSRSIELTSQSDFTLSDNDVLTLGLAYEERDGGSAGSFAESVDVASVFLQNAWSFYDRFHVTAGVRRDDHSQYGGETTYRLAATGSFGSGTRLHGSFGTGFKAPTLNDLFFPFFSNPTLQPETSRGFDFGVEQRWGGDRWRFDATWFEIDFEDLIAFSFVTFVPENVARAESSGVELVLEFRPGPKLQLAASHTYNETEDRATRSPLARRPENRSTLGLFFRPSQKLSGAASLIAVGDRVDSDGSRLDDYVRVDLSLGYQLRDGVEPYLRVENLFDDTTEEIRGFTTPGAVAVVGLRVKY